MPHPKTENILLHRGAGYGDVLLLTSAIPGLQEKFPDAKIYFKTGKGFDALILHDPRIAGICWNYYPPLDIDFDISIRVNHALTWGKNIWMPIAMCRFVGVKFSLPQLFLLPEELQVASSCDVAITNKYPVIGGRAYRHMDQLAKYLVDFGYHVKQIDLGPPMCKGIDNSPLTLREAAAVVAKARCLVTTDCVFLHVGVIFERPIVAIFYPAWSSSKSQYVPGSWIANWKWAPERILPMVKHLLGDGPAPNEENTFDPAYKTSQS